MSGFLQGLTVIDMAFRAPLAGRMLAQLGAEVILIEPPTGNPTRRKDPFAWLSFAAGKRSVTLDLHTDADQETFRQLVRRADILIESAAPGQMADLGLDFDALHADHPALVYVSVTPFGSTGPKAHWEESDLVLWAAGGALYPNRDLDGPPLRISAPQAWLHAAGDAAGGALVAYRARLNSGVGQHVDISVQQSVTQATLSSIVAEAVGHRDYSITNPEGRKSLDLSGSGSRTRRSKWPLVDGMVEMHLGMGPASGERTNNFFAWMAEEGWLPERMREWNWVTLPARLDAGEVSEADVEEAREATASFLATKTKIGLIEEAMRRRIMLAPVSTVADLVSSPHHAARHFFQQVSMVALPGDFALGPDDAFVPLTPAPALGQHNAELLGRSRPANWREALSANADRDAAPFADLKVLDLAWVVAGPAIGRVLADYGAEVIRVESRRRIDGARTIGPFPDGRYDLERSGCFDGNNAGKLGLSLDLTKPEAREVIRDLVARCDVVVESFAPGQMAKWGLSYPELKEMRQDIILVSTSLLGQSGPYSGFAGFGNIGAAMAGFQHIVGWPGALPVGPFGPYTDYVGPRFGLVALLAALEHRRRTGEGCWLDVSQTEAGIQFLAPQIAALGVTGDVAGPMGNSDAGMAPHGVFACAGQCRWIAIAVRDDSDWARLAPLIGGDALDGKWATFEARKRHEGRIDDLVTSWTSSRLSEDLAALLQSVGVPAHVVASSADMVADPHLIAREHFIRLPHERGGVSVIEASRYTLSRTPATYVRTAPSYGRDNSHVLESFLRYDGGRIDRLEAAGAIN